MKKLLLLLAIIGICYADQWAVLVAGSMNGKADIWNYRHQSDIYHAFRILTTNGIPVENIITMTYDDTAYNSANPFPGQVYNYLEDTVNEYKGFNKDYTKHLVTPDNFLAVLKGNSTHVHGRKVLKSSKDDHVFLYFADHGAPGLVAFPNETQVLYAHELMNAFQYMHDHHMYKEMVVYIEACESGSMFAGQLSKKQKTLLDLNIYALTAASPFQSSYACCFDDKIGTYLADVFSINWMLDTQFHKTEAEPIFHQYLHVANGTNTSIVCEYGNLDISKEKLWRFQGASPIDVNASKVEITDVVPSRRVAINSILRQLTKELNNPLQSMDTDNVDRVLSQLVDHWNMMKRARITHKNIVPPPADCHSKVDSYAVEAYIKNMPYAPIEYDFEMMSGLF